MAKTKDVEKNEKLTNKKVETEKITTTKKTTSKNKTKATKSVTSKGKTKGNSKTKTTKVNASARSKKFQSEYYDLPYKYNKTVVKVLAQTPTTLFVYWEISEKDIAKLKQNYGENFFEVTKPVLILYNDTLNYAFEIEINDFANSWYIHVNDSKCDYHVELGRKPIPQVSKKQSEKNTIEDTPYIPYYIYISSSNNMSAPNDKILFNPQSKITFKNVKTGNTRQADIREFKFIANSKNKFTIQQLYNHLYPNENFDYKEFLRNPSSGITSSR